VPALIANVVIYFFLIEQESIKQSILKNASLEFFRNDGNVFLKGVIIFSVIIIISLFIKALSSQFFWVSSRAKENLELYPNYVRFKERIDKDFEKKFGVKFNAQEVQNLIRFKIMEEYKEFNKTFLWYISTEYYATRDIATATIFTSIILSPFVFFQDKFILWQYILWMIVGALPFSLLFWLVRKKIAQINRLEAVQFKLENRAVDKDYYRKSKLKFTCLDFLLIACIFAGILSNLAAAYTNYFPFTQLLFVWGVNLLLLPPIYLLFINVFLDYKSFKKTLLDTFISIRYGDELFNEGKE
jgi:hypothetical protein